MFFSDPVAAFTNIASAMRPAARFVTIAWRSIADNEWLRSVFTALAIGRDVPSPPAGSPGPFGLADPARASADLRAAGFEAIDIAPIDAPVWIGDDADDATAFIRSTGFARGMTEGYDVSDRAVAFDALRVTMGAHENAEGVTFGSGAWLISASRPG